MQGQERGQKAMISNGEEKPFRVYDRREIGLCVTAVKFIDEKFRTNA